MRLLDGHCPLDVLLRRLPLHISRKHFREMVQSSRKDLQPPLIFIESFDQSVSFTIEPSYQRHRNAYLARQVENSNECILLEIYRPWRILYRFYWGSSWGELRSLHTRAEHIKFAQEKFMTGCRKKKVIPLSTFIDSLWPSEILYV